MNPLKRKLKGAMNWNLALGFAIAVIAVVITLVIGMYIVQQVNSTVQVNVGFHPSTIFSLIGVVLIVGAAALIIFYLKVLGGGQ